MKQMNNEHDSLNELFDELFPLCRSISGEGIEKTIDILGKWLPLEREFIKSGTEIFDWTTPPQWNFKRARLWGPFGELICDSAVNNLHVVNYSSPVKGYFSLDELRPHLHSIPDKPKAIPYVTSYYKRTWGFCLADDVKRKLKDGTYYAEIDSHFDDNGEIPYAQSVLKGESKKEILLTSYICHPSLANNELSGPLALVALFHRVNKWPKRRFTYRFLFNPETIGSLCFLHNYYEKLNEAIEAGLILTCTGGPNSKLRYKASRNENNIFNKVINDLPELNEAWNLISFSPLDGSDERQYCAPGFNWPIGQVSRTPPGEYDGYHNSLDTKDFMQISQVIETVDELESLLRIGELFGKPLNMKPYGEPQLGKRGLYPNMNTPAVKSNSSDGLSDGRKTLNHILTILSEADGTQFMSDILKKAPQKLNLSETMRIIERLEREKLIKFNTGKTL